MTRRPAAPATDEQRAGLLAMADAILEGGGTVRHEGGRAIFEPGRRLVWKLPPPAAPPPQQQVAIARPREKRGTRRARSSSSSSSKDPPGESDPPPALTPAELLAARPRPAGLVPVGPLARDVLLAAWCVELRRQLGIDAA